MSNFNNLTEAQKERLILLGAEVLEITGTIEDILLFGYNDIPEGESQSNEEYLNEIINGMLAVRSRMYDLGDMKSKIPNLNQIWRDKLKFTQHQLGG